MRRQRDGGAIDAPEVPAEAGRYPGGAQPSPGLAPSPPADVTPVPAAGPREASSSAPRPVTAAVSTTSEDAVRAGWPRRLAAFAIDGLILTIVTGSLWGRLLASFANRMSQAVAAQAHPAARGAHGAVGRVFGQTIAPYLIVLVPTIIVAVVYYWLLTGYWGTTIGKRAVGTWVVSADDGSKISLPRSLLRAVIFVAGSEVVPFWFLVDNLWLLRDPSRQALHDKAARTLVVRQRPHCAGESQSTRQ